MRKLSFYMAFIAGIGMLNAQVEHNPIAKGNVYVLSEPSGSSYKYIDFPKPNMIMKRGAIPNFNNLVGHKLIIKEIIIDDNGTNKVILGRKDGKNFFRFFPKVISNLDEALALAGNSKSLKIR